MDAVSPSVTTPTGRSSTADVEDRWDGREPTFEWIYAQHSSFVCLTLRRFGVRPADLDDLVHDVFVVVHRRRHSFDGSGGVTTWLFAICRRVAANYRRRRCWLSERSNGIPAGAEPAEQLPADELLARREERAMAEHILGKLELEKRHVFVMFEVETRSCVDIAAAMNIPVGTVYSRLHAARRKVRGIVARRRLS